MTIALSLNGDTYSLKNSSGQKVGGRFSSRLFAVFPWVYQCLTPVTESVVSFDSEMCFSLSIIGPSGALGITGS